MGLFRKPLASTEPAIVDTKFPVVFSDLANQVVQAVRDVDVACGIDGKASGSVEFTRGSDGTVAAEGEVAVARDGVNVARGLATARCGWNYANRVADLRRQ